MLRSAVNYEDNFESCVCVLHITSFRLREFLPCKPICLKPTARPPGTLPSSRGRPSPSEHHRRTTTTTTTTTRRYDRYRKQTDLSGNLRSRDPRNLSTLNRPGSPSPVAHAERSSDEGRREIPRVCDTSDLSFYRISVYLRK